MLGVRRLGEPAVLIVGGSLVGLATSMFLGSHGVDCLTVEKHRGTAIHPRAGFFQLRTLELMREVGIEERVIKAAYKKYDPNGGSNAVETLAGREIVNYAPDINQGIEDISPARRLFMPQQVLEPILHQRATEFGSQFRYSTELVDFSQDDTGVSAIVRDVDSGVESTIRSQYLVACDGNRSPIRERLGISMRGYPVMSQSITIYFRADCANALRGRNLGVIYVNNRNVRGFFRLEKTGLGGFLVVFTAGDINGPNARNVAEGITIEKAAQLVRDAVGEPGLEVEVEDVAKWTAVCRAAESFQKGRIFIAGDAAHTMTPTGGFGGNTGIQDAHNIAWKLAYVARGRAGQRLLDTYTAERQPAGMQAIEQAYTRYVTRSDPDLKVGEVKRAINPLHVEFNRYRSDAVIPDAALVDDGAIDIDPRKSLGRPGTRAPHVELKQGEKIISTLDLYRGQFVLMTGHDGSAWLGAAKVAGGKVGIEIAAHVVGRPGSSSEIVDLPPHRRRLSSLFTVPFNRAHGIDPSGAVLVRPDGYVACRLAHFDESASVENLLTSLNSVLCR
ncbi:FAD-dependent monooxygenase [Bradyrhizobium sp. LTSPM299]|uniref:FAD-dependent monooxygenase n=1 Tax=Bradyrhizobium sp. LTSPM299 TaxID=1619233 RepID=UPI0024BF3DDA|nr:FAD-dependent monooxygenase [Bradyrhizobium sp. LTSPM299]